MIDEETLFNMIVTQQRSNNNKIKRKIHNLKYVLFGFYTRFVGIFSKEKQQNLHLKQIDSQLNDIIYIMETVGSSDGYSYDIIKGSKELKSLVKNQKMEVNDDQQ